MVKIILTVISVAIPVLVAAIEENEKKKGEKEK